MSHLVIVESAAKTKIISKYLNANSDGKIYDVVASMGHIRDLDSGSLSIDIDAGFVPKYEIMQTKKALVKRLKERVKNAETLFIATDCDREGEAIAMHLKNVLKPTCPCYRVLFSEITQRAITKAFSHPKRDVDIMLVEAQETRRILDRVVGYKISPLLWKHFRGVKGLSAGRVQSAALAIIVKRETDVRSFSNGVHHWNIQGSFKIDGERVTGKITQKFNTAIKVKDLLRNISFTCKLIEYIPSEKFQKPPQPFKTSTLQQAAFTKLGMSAAMTMEVAQQLYETGYITYMRTDTINISRDFAEDTHKFITHTFGKEYIATSLRTPTTGAHEAIRPTNIKDGGEALEKKSHLKKLYKLIWERTIMSLMSDHKQLVGTYKVGLSNLVFISTIARTLFPGFAVIEGTEIDHTSLPVGKRIKCDKVDAVDIWDEPVSRYNEASLINTLEKYSIGRPSTYTSIIGKLIEKDFIRIDNIEGKLVEATDYTRLANNESIDCKKRDVFIGSEKKRIQPTHIGQQVHTFVFERFPYITDSQFTGGMEDDLDKIAVGGKSKLDVLNTFWNVFSKDLSKEATIPKVSKAHPNHIKDATSIVDGIVHYTLRVAQYGPVLQWQGVDGKITYIGLEPYLQHTQKLLEDMDVKDIRYLRSMPLRQEDGTYLTYGRYGFYKT
jgi:DNA topoisomerase-1